MDSRTKAFETFKTAILKPVQNTNRYIPRITTGDLKSFWDNVDTKKLERISTIKSLK
jgi:hypothetical protein